MDLINLEILEDGTITMRISDISAGNHMSADELMVEFEKAMGGKMIFEKDPDAKAHAHAHRHGLAHAHRH